MKPVGNTWNMNRRHQRERASVGGGGGGGGGGEPTHRCTLREGKKWRGREELRQRMKGEKEERTQNGRKTIKGLTVQLNT